MNKLVNTYLDAVDSGIAIHKKFPRPDDFDRIVGDLAIAVRALNQESCDKITDFAILLNQKGIPNTKPLSLYDLKQQVDMALCIAKPPEVGDFIWTTQDFEIRRRK